MTGEDGGVVPTDAEDFGFEVVDGDSHNAVETSTASRSRRPLVVVAGVVAAAAIVGGLAWANREQPPIEATVTIDDVTDIGRATTYYNPDGVVLGGGDGPVTTNQDFGSAEYADPSPALLGGAVAVPATEKLGARVSQVLTLRNDRPELWELEVIGLVGSELTKPVSGKAANPVLDPQVGARRGADVTVAAGATPKCTSWTHDAGEVSVAVRALPIAAQGRRLPEPRDMLISLPTRASEQMASALTAVCTPYVLSGFTGVGTAKNVDISVNGPGGFNWSATVEGAVFAGLKGTVRGEMPGVSSASVKGIGTGESFSFDEKGLAKISGSVLLNASMCEEVSRWAEIQWAWATLSIDLPKDSGLRFPMTAQSVLLSPSDLIKVRRIYGSVCGVPLEAVSAVTPTDAVTSVTTQLKGDPAFWKGIADVVPDPATAPGQENAYPTKAKYEVDFGTDGTSTLKFFFNSPGCGTFNVPRLKVTSRTSPPVFAIVDTGTSFSRSGSC